MAKQTSEREELYRKVSPPGDLIPVKEIMLCSYFP